MCVTLKPAMIGQLSVMTYAIIDNDPRATHVSAMQVAASNRAPGANCMVFHFPGNQLQLVHGPEQTKTFMRDITQNLPEVEMRSQLTAPVTAVDPRIEDYGDDYTVVLAEHTGEIPDALASVPEDRRPDITERFQMMIAWYEDQFPDYGFVLACFNGDVNPTHPIVVQYHPHSDDVLFAPGLIAHDGNLPKLSSPVDQKSLVAFGVQRVTLQSEVQYADRVSSDWAPRTVSGFSLHGTGANLDFMVPLLNLEEGFSGEELYADLVL